VTPSHFSDSDSEFAFDQSNEEEYNNTVQSENKSSAKNSNNVVRDCATMILQV